MSSATISPVPGEVRPAPKTRLEIFVSYAKEDAQFVRQIADELQKPFGMSLNFFVDKESIKQGDDWRKKINEKLDVADILLVVSTGQQRASHDFPGYEVGYFSGSKKYWSGIPGLEPKIIPLTIGGEPPSSVAQIQGTIIREEDIRAPLRDSGAETKFLQSLQDDNPVRKLFTDLSEMLATMSGIHPTRTELKVLDGSIDESTARFYQLIFTYLKSRVCSESIPERKIIVRAALPPLAADEDEILNNATIELVGQSFEIFGLPARAEQLAWPAFTATTGQSDIAKRWKEGIRTLSLGALSGTSADNYYFVSSFQTEQVFRLFVSLNRTYYGGQKEVHIYTLQLAALKDYGDLKTTKLMKAVAVGLRYRSLFLENGSPFSPDIMWYSVMDFRQQVTDLWNELQHVLTDAKQARIDDPQLLSYIYGPGGHDKLDKLAGVYRNAENDLNRMTHAVLAAADDKVGAMKPDFMAVLQKFCDLTEQMNREFTSKALLALEAEISRKLVEPVGAAAAPSRAAVA
jgi:hypothetical protein